MNECSDPKSGVLLAAYELDILPEEDLERFEKHMMTCDYCFGQIQEFEGPARTLLQSDVVQESVSRIVAEPSQSRSWVSRLGQHLWPESPLILKPGLAWALMALLLVPAYLGVTGLLRGGTQVRPLQSVHLVPHRTINHNVFYIESDLDGVISFVVPEVVQGRVYDVRIVTDEDIEVMAIDDFAGFDGFGTGRLLVPLTTMRPGTYHLAIREAGERSGPPIHDYRFRIR